MTHKTIPVRHLRNVSFTSLSESWHKQLDLVRSDRFQPYFIIAFTLWLVGAVEVIQKTIGQRLDPLFWMLVAVLITAYSGVRIFRLSPQQLHIRRSKPSAAANEMVNRMVSNGFAVYHQPAGQKGSDGYIVVGRGGIYAMEVKARKVFGSRTIELRKPNELVLGGRISDCRPLQQAQSAAEKIRRGLEGLLQVPTSVKPLVVFLGDWRINQSETSPDVAVINAGELHQYLDGQPPIFDESEVAQISNRLDDPAFAVAL